MSDLKIRLKATEEQRGQFESLYLTKTDWIKRFGKITSLWHEDWGLVQEIRTFYDNELEVEFGITTREWINTTPIDEGTKKVATDGVKLLFDRTGDLQKFLNFVNLTRQPK